MVKFSVVICTYNRCESLRDTVQALLNQHLDPKLELEIIVVDNNSKDQTRDVIEEVCRTSKWPVHYLFESTQGKSYAQNAGIRVATGDFIAFCDDDVVAGSNWIQELHKAFLIYGADCVGGPVQPLWSRKPPKWLEDPARQFGPLAILDRGDKPLIAGEAERTAGNFLIGSNFAVRNLIFREVGFYRTDLGRAGKTLGGGEDSEMISRLLTAGKRLVYMPNAVVRHKVPPARMTLAYLRKWNYWMARSTVRISKFKQVTPKILLLECVKSAAAALCYYAIGAKVKAVGAEINLWWRLGMLVELLSGKRKKCQASA